VPALHRRCGLFRLLRPVPPHDLNPHNALHAVGYPRAMRLAKWTALGNHFLLVERDALPFPLTARRAQILCDPAVGLGADGVLEVWTPDGADVAVRVWNLDGSIAEVSGNGTRIAVAWAAERIGAEALTVATDAGLGRARVLADGRIGVTMGTASLDGPQYAPVGEAPGPEHRFVSIGNPHMVLDVDDISTYPLETEGPRLEHHAWFPERTNVEAIRVLDAHRLELRVWERGVGETRACGSGAVASAVAAVSSGRCSSPVVVEMPGGRVEVEVSDDLAVQLIGTAERLYGAELDDALVTRLTAAV
jgi:diaminopimelate epimerase